MKYPNLEREIFQRGIKLKSIAECIGVTEKTLRKKRLGITDFTWTEICKMQKRFFSDVSKDELFEKSA